MKSKRNFVVFILGVILLAAVIYGLMAQDDRCALCFVKSFSVETVRDYIQGFGSWAIVVYILLYTANTFSPFFPPIFIMSLTAGAVFGPVLGTVALTLGTFAGTSAAFFTARYFGRSWVEKIIQGKSADVYEKLSQNGFLILLPIRVIGFPPYGIIDFICGLSKMKYSEFVAATMIGAAPWIITQVLLADRFAQFNPKDPVLWGLLVVFILMIVITSKIVKKKESQK